MHKTSIYAENKCFIDTVLCYSSPTGYSHQTAVCVHYVVVTSHNTTEFNEPHRHVMCCI